MRRRGMKRKRSVAISKQPTSNCAVFGSSFSILTALRITRMVHQDSQVAAKTRLPEKCLLGLGRRSRAGEHRQEVPTLANLARMSHLRIFTTEGTEFTENCVGLS